MINSKQTDQKEKRKAWIINIRNEGGGHDTESIEIKNTGRYYEQLYAKYSTTLMKWRNPWKYNLLKVTQWEKI